MRYAPFTAALLLINIAVFSTSCTDGKAIKEAFEQGLEAGTILGYKNGFEVGRDSGYIEGVADGKAMNQENIYLAGFSDGHKQGKEEGCTNGYLDGYEQGLFEGLAKGRQEGKTMAFSRADKREFAFRYGTISILWLAVCMGCYWFFRRKLI